MTTSLKGRPPNVTPTTAYDVRRSLFIVQILAVPGSPLEALQFTARAWGLDDSGDFETLLRRMSQAALEHGRKG